MSPISDCNISEKSDLINWVEEENEILSDNGFADQDFCSISKGFTETGHLRIKSNLQKLK